MARTVRSSWRRSRPVLFHLISHPGNPTFTITCSFFANIFG